MTAADCFPSRRGPHRFNIFGNPTPTRRASCRWLELLDAKGRDWSFELVRINDARAGRRHRYSWGFTGFNNHRPRADGTGMANGFDNGFGPGGAVVKVDTDAAERSEPCVTVWSSTTAFPSEPVFVGRPVRCPWPFTQRSRGATGSSSVSVRPQCPPWWRRHSHFTEKECIPRTDCLACAPSQGGTAEDDGVLLFLGYDLARRESFLGVLDASDMAELARAYCGSRCCVSFHGQWIPAVD